MCLINSVARHENVHGTKFIGPLFLTSALDGGEWSSSRPGCFTPGERTAGVHWIGGWVGPRAGLDAAE
jgi:hypothetical protein